MLQGLSIFQWYVVAMGRIPHIMILINILFIYGSMWRIYFAEKDASNVERRIILPGSFNPLHDGHLKLLEVATRYVAYS